MSPRSYSRCGVGRCIMTGLLVFSTIVIESWCRPSPAMAQTVLLDMPSYTVYSNQVVDSAYGHTATSSDGDTIDCPFVPVFHPEVDMSLTYWVTVDQGTNRWTPITGIDQYPQLNTGHTIVDAVYKLALETLYRCTSGEFIRSPGSGEVAGMWQAGYRKGEGYGVWNRDTVYVALLMGNLIDPVGAELSLAFVVNSTLVQDKFLKSE